MEYAAMWENYNIKSIANIYFNPIINKESKWSLLRFQRVYFCGINILFL
jgi:hypothetical protein